MKFGQISEDEIHRLVDGFYAKIRADPQFAPIFECAIHATVLFAGHGFVQLERIVPTRCLRQWLLVEGST